MRAEHPAERPDRQGTREVEAALPSVGQSLQALSGSAVSDPLVMVPRAPCGSKGRVAAGTSGPTAWLWHLYMQLVEIESTPTYYPQNLISVWP